MGDVNYSCLFIICHLFLIMSGVMILQYKLGTFLFISGFMFAFFDSVYYLMIKKKYDFTMVGEVWYYIHPSSLQIIQPVVERYLLVILWDPILLNLLLLPFGLFIIIIGSVLLFSHFLLRKRN